MQRLGWIADLAAVAGGGALGSTLRWLITVAAVSLPHGTTMLGTLTVNVTGCLLIGLLSQWAVLDATQWTPRTLLALRMGVLGGLTTFSTFAAEAVWLAGDGRVHDMSLYLAGNLVLGLAAVWAGAWIMRGWWG